MAEKSKNLNEPVMTSPRLDRKLVAILAADVVNFARHMEHDEERTLQLLSDRREIIDGLVDAFTGRITGTAGDSVIAEFASVIDAVDCAVKIQTFVMQANNRAGDTGTLSFRIGINVGDVMVKDADIFGDGVNVAARLESIAEPDGVCVSRGVHEYVKKQSNYVFEDLGEQRVKNIEHPLRAFRILFDAGEPVTSEEEAPPDERINAASPLEPPEFELKFWETIQDSVEPAEFEAYLEKYPNGTFAELARTRINSFAEQERQPPPPEPDPIELAFWESVKDSETTDLFETYLDKYPDGEFSELARVMIEKLKTQTKR